LCCILIFINFAFRRCDNSIEFKGKRSGEFKNVYEKWSIPIINGRGYYLKTQDIIKIVNRTFKRQLRAIHAELSIREQVGFFP
jgi:hypothetical protein